MKPFLILLTFISGLLPQYSQAAPRRETQGPHGSYLYQDWAELGPQNAFDVAPRPVGGMAAFVSRIEYPRHLRLVRERFLIKISFDEKGRVVAVKGFETKHRELQESVIKAVRTTKWLPALKNRVPIPVRVTFPVEFRPR
jgi:hypothetical protein